VTARRMAGVRWTALVRPVPTDPRMTPRRTPPTGPPWATARRAVTVPRRGWGRRPGARRRWATGGPVAPGRRAASPTGPAPGRCPLTGPQSPRLRPPARRKTRRPATTTPGLRPANGDRRPADRLRGTGARGG